MTVILLNKTTETYETIHNVLWFKRIAVSIGFSEKKFRYEWHVCIEKSITQKHFPCNKYEIHSIIA